jgi:hypothetical protein
VAFGRLSKNRGGTPIDVRLPMQARPCPYGTAEYALRLSAFRFRFFLSFFAFFLFVIAGQKARSAVFN